MKIIQRGKTTKNEIPIRTCATEPESFGLYETVKGGETEATYLGWTLKADQEGKGRFAGHSFEIVVDAAELGKLKEAIEIAQRKFTKEVGK